MGGACPEMAGAWLGRATSLETDHTTLKVPYQTSSCQHAGYWWLPEVGLEVTPMSKDTFLTFAFRIVQYLNFSPISYFEVP